MLIQGNSYRIPLADKSVHCVVTSPPYWSLRDYNLPPLVWGGDSGCVHEWGEERIVKNTPPRDHNGAYAFGDTRGNEPHRAGTMLDASQGQFCRHCNAWLGSLGLEPTPQLFVTHLVEVFREVWRVLRDDGTAWVNLGDSYAAQQGNGFNTHAITNGTNRVTEMQKQQGDLKVNTGLKPKNLVGIPWRVAFALQDDGWYLRSDIIWSKTNPMPESVTDRPTKSHEYVFLLAKRERYFYDAEAVREPHETLTNPRYKNLDKTVIDWRKRPNNGEGHKSGFGHMGFSNGGRNRRTVWSISTEPYPGAHYATFPTKLVEPCVLAGTSGKGCCPACGSPWERVVERTTATSGQRPGYTMGCGARNDGERAGHFVDMTTTTTGYRPTCACYHGPAYPEQVPAIVLDPFAGSGTVGQVCRQTGRRFIGIDLSPVYIAENAMARAEGLTSQKAIEELPLFSWEAS